MGMMSSRINRVGLACLALLWQATSLIAEPTPQDLDVFFPSNELPTEMQESFASVTEQFVQNGSVELVTQNVFGQNVTFVRAKDAAAAAAFTQTIQTTLQGRLPHVVDSPGGFTFAFRGSRVALSQEILVNFTTDHHGPNFRDADYRTNSTMKLVRELQKIGPERFREKLWRVTTDKSR